MASQILSPDTVRDRLAELGHAQMQKLAKDSGVPFGTLWKIREGETKNPGIETVGKFWKHLPERRQKARVE